MEKKFHLGLSVILFTLLVIICPSTRAQNKNVEYVWPNGAPDAKGEAPGDKPTLPVFFRQRKKLWGQPYSFALAEVIGLLLRITKAMM